MTLGPGKPYDPTRYVIAKRAVDVAHLYFGIVQVSPVLFFRNDRSSWLSPIYSEASSGLIGKMVHGS